MQEIQNCTIPNRWKHCPRIQNPADLLTRGIQARELMDSHMWMHGPKWLEETCPEYQKDSDFEINTDFETDEMKRNPTDTVLTTVVHNIPALMEYDRYSDFCKVVRIMTWVLRFVNNYRTNQRRNLCIILSAEDIENGRITLLKCVQKEHFSEEINCLQRENMVKTNSPLYRL